LCIGRIDPKGADDGFGERHFTGSHAERLPM
jgi:hypothetical protein